MPEWMIGETDSLGRLLVSLGIPPHMLGYRELLAAIPLFAKDPQQSMTKELYPAVAAQFGCGDWRAAECAIRCVIAHAWNRREPALWQRYFPESDRQPTNKAFIAALSEFVRE